MANIHVEQRKQAPNAYLVRMVVVVLLAAAVLVYYFATRHKTGDTVITPADTIQLLVNKTAIPAVQADSCLNGKQIE